MIRKLQLSDVDEVLHIWLESSIQAHGFIDKEFWKSKVKDMREIYLPSGETYVFEQEGLIVGFLSLSEDRLAAIFVSPDWQGKGIGTQLMQKAKEMHDTLELTVYKDNIQSIEFYKKHGFEIAREQMDSHTGHPELVMKYKE